MDTRALIRLNHSRRLPRGARLHARLFGVVALVWLGAGCGELKSVPNDGGDAGGPAQGRGGAGGGSATGRGGTTGTPDGGATGGTTVTGVAGGGAGVIGQGGTTAGVAGTPGIAGTPGVAGTPGTAGKPGVAGTTGIAGTTGVAGTPGIAGTPGVAGTPGTAGSNTGTPAAFSITPLSASLTTAVDVGTTGTQIATLVVTNTGTATATPALAISNMNDFAITNGCTAALAGGATCSLTVKVTPKKWGPLSTTLTVTPGATGQNAATISGTGRDQLALTTAVAGTGTGSLSAPAGVQGDGINCPGDCSESYYRITGNPQVTITASYDPALTTIAWSAPCTNSGTTCAVTLTAAQTVTVTFTKRTYNVTVTRSAEATGATGTVLGGTINCGSTCTATVEAGSRLSLTATPASGYYFSAWNGGGCTGGALACTTTPITANTTIDAKFTRANIIFTTSTTYLVSALAANGAGNPQTGADKFCQTSAAAGTAPGLTGRTWTSLITLGTGSASAGATRLGTKRGWVRPDGKPFGNAPADFFTNNVVFYPPALDENNKVVPNAQSQTAALGDGCVGWTSSLRADYRTGGVPTAGGGGWNGAYGMPCDYELRLYCMSIDYAATVPAPGRTSTSKVAFLTAGSFKPAGSAGISSADALCAQEASAASLSGTFRALIATSTASAASRFASAGPWVRSDGVSVGTIAQLTAATLQLDAPIDVSASGVYYGLRGPWTGAELPSTVGTELTTCTPSGGASWTAPMDATIKGTYGRDWNTDVRMFQDFSSTTCDSSAPLYCLQQ